MGAKTHTVPWKFGLRDCCKIAPKLGFDSMWHINRKFMCVFWAHGTMYGALMLDLMLVLCSLEGVNQWNALFLVDWQCTPGSLLQFPLMACHSFREATKVLTAYMINLAFVSHITGYLVSQSHETINRK